MSRLVMFLGILLILIGGAGFVFGMIGVPLLIANTATQLSDPTAADLCKPGEKLEIEHGAEEYSFSNGYSRSQYYYCVNDAGTRRDVTLDAAKNFIGGFLPSLGSLLIPIAGGGLCTIGFFLALFGFLFSRRRRFQTATNQFAFVSPNAPASFTAPSMATRAPVQGDLAAKLRQIEEAHTSGLINDEEYQRMRQEILDSMQ
ncbi:MAG: hypothetical protein GC204_10715 [Chloroflexi bacterium]|nr:hypothetical protein [Chloroflexota bacterium]